MTGLRGSGNGAPSPPRQGQDVARSEGSGIRLGDRVHLAADPGTEGRVVGLPTATTVRVYWLRHPTQARQTTVEPVSAFAEPIPVWLDAAGRPCPTTPCARCGRPTPLYRVHGQDLWNRPDWQPFQVTATPSWCGHPNAAVYLPEGTGWWREVPVLGGDPAK